MSTRRLAESVEGLNSSLALAAGDLWPKKGAPICRRADTEKLYILKYFAVLMKTSRYSWKLRVTRENSWNLREKISWPPMSPNSGPQRTGWKALTSDTSYGDSYSKVVDFVNHKHRFLWKSILKIFPEYWKKYRTERSKHASLLNTAINLEPLRFPPWVTPPYLMPWRGEGVCVWFPTYFTVIALGVMFLFALTREHFLEIAKKFSTYFLCSDNVSTMLWVSSSTQF